MTVTDCIEQLNEAGEKTRVRITIRPNANMMALGRDIQVALNQGAISIVHPADLERLRQAYADGRWKNGSVVLDLHRHDVFTHNLVATLLARHLASVEIVRD